MTASTLTAPTYIGRCKHKGCKHATRVADSAVQELDSYRKRHDVLITADGAEYDRTRPFILNGMHVCARCPEHGVYRLAFLQGQFSEKHECDARCMAATGPNCDCSCGGANHGANHV